MLLRSRQHLRYFQFQAFRRIEGLRHGVFTRIGGRSRGPFRGFNIARSVGDAPAAVRANRELLADIFAPGRLFFTQQTHGTRVHVLDGGPPGEAPPQADAVAPPEADAEAPPQADALVCDRPGTFIAIQVADCQAVLLVDPRRRVVANIHSGWRGSIANIIGRTIKILETRFGSRAADLLAGIPPSLGACCGEFRHYREELPPEVWRYGNKAAHFDFWALSRDQLVAAGVPAGRIFQSRICTRCNTGLFYSYRAHQHTGRCVAVIGFEAG
jgi:YfiH family protein